MLIYIYTQMLYIYIWIQLLPKTSSHTAEKRIGWTYSIYSLTIAMENGPCVNDLLYFST